MGDDMLFTVDPLWAVQQVQQESWTPYLSDQVLFAHPQTFCENQGRNCSVHNPSDHGLREWMQWFEDDITYRVCPHGENHADPDEIRAQHLVRGCTPECDGCCQPLRANDAFRKFDLNQMQIKINDVRKNLEAIKKGKVNLNAGLEYAKQSYTPWKTYDAKTMLLSNSNIYHIDIN